MISDCSSLCNDTISTIENAIGVVFALYNTKKNSNNAIDIGLDFNRICDYSVIGLHAFITDQVAKYIQVALKQKYDCTDKSVNKIAEKIIQHGNPQNIMDLFDFLQPAQSKKIKGNNNYAEYCKLYSSRNAYVHENGENKLDITHIESNKNKYYNFLKELDNMIGVKDDAPEFIP
jgi:hypothetical protein